MLNASEIEHEVDASVVFWTLKTILKEVRYLKRLGGDKYQKEKLKKSLSQ